MFKVAHNHQIIGEFPVGSHCVITADQGLVVYAADGKTELARFGPGEWSGAGTNVEHAYIDDDPACPTCHPPGGRLN